MASLGGSCRAEGETDEGNGIRLFPILAGALRTRSRSPHPALRATFPQGKALRAHTVCPYIVVASSISLASAYGESSLIPLLDSPHRTRGYRRWASAGAPKLLSPISYLHSSLSTLHSPLSAPPHFPRPARIEWSIGRAGGD